MDKFIVAEVSKTWNEENFNGTLLCQKFEQVINFNFNRGYKLIDWKFSATHYNAAFTESIIAVFEKIEVEMLRDERPIQ